MTKLWLSPYELVLTLSGEKRKGYLLKVQDQDFKEGYGDIFPWPEFGDPRYEEIPKLLNVNKLPPLLKRSLETAKLDGKARSQKKSLLENLKRRNHYFMNTLTVDELRKAQDRNFRRFKVKVCLHPDLELSQLECLQKLLKKQNFLRLDCNGKGDEEFFKNLESLRESIEFIEDPFSNSKGWHSSWPFAYDQPGFAFEKVQTSWQIIKPNKQSKEDIKGEKIVYTSSMGHPVGLAHGFFFASRQGPQYHDDGFMSHKLYQNNSFYPFIQEEGSWLSFKPGLGIGFDEALKGQEWTKL